MNDKRSKLPSVNSLIETIERSGSLKSVPRPVVVKAIRAVIERSREDGADRLDHKPILDAANRRCLASKVPPRRRRADPVSST